MDKITKKKSEKYSRLIDCALELFEKKGPHVVSIDEIVKAAGVAKGTFYLYFQDKYDLISKLILDKAARYMRELNFRSNVIETPAEFDSTLLTYLEYVCKFLEKNKTLTLLVDKNINVCVNALIETTDSPLYALYEEIKKYLLKCGIEEKEIDVKLYLCVELIVSSCCNAILREHPYGLCEVKCNLHKIILHAVAGEKCKGEVTV